LLLTRKKLLISSRNGTRSTVKEEETIMIQKVVKGWKLRALEWPSPAKGRLWSHPMERMVTKQVEWPKQMVTTVTSRTMQNHKEQLGAKGLKLT